MDLIVILAFMIGILCGVIAENLRLKTDRKSFGTLWIDVSDPTENPYMFLELAEENLADIADGKSVELTVRAGDYLSRQ